MAISGGEPTLNKDPKARPHLDTNATILTPKCIDELIEVGVTDIGLDLKGLKNEKLAKAYLTNS